MSVEPFTATEWAHADASSAEFVALSEPRGDHLAPVATDVPLDAAFPRALKRGIDLLISVPVLVVTLPVLALLALLVRFTSPGPALFKQTRAGRGGREFSIYKFRSMCVGAEEKLRAEPALYEEFLRNGCKLPRDRDPRVTRVGRFLRRTSLDELPQIINVVLGTMSLVGPRPVPTFEATTLYGAKQDLYFAVKPGLTGLWQVSGRSNLSQSDRAELDEEYVVDWTLGLDVKLLVRTVPAVLTGNGAF